MQIVEKHLHHYNVKINSMVKAKLQQIVVHCTRSLDMTKKIPSQLNRVRKQKILNGAFLKCLSICVKACKGFGFRHIQTADIGVTWP